MATRLYLPASAATVPISPDADSAWEDTTILARANTSTSKLGNAMATVSFTDSDATEKDVLFRQYISLPLTAGQTITASQDILMVVRAKQGASTNNMFIALCVRVIASDGTTVQKSLLAVARSTVLEISETTLTNRRFTWTSNTGAYVTVAGDRLVLEVGTGGDPTAGSDHDTDLRLGDSAASDLAYDNTSTDDYSPWVEIEQTLTFVDNETFTTAGEVTRAFPAGYNTLVEEVWGGGGGGGNAGVNAGGGGGGGAYSKSTVSVSAGTNRTYRVGANGTATNAGEDSWSGSSSTTMAKGGAAGTDSAGGSGGASGSGFGDTKFSGGDGAAGGVSDGGGGGSSAGTGANGGNASGSTGGTAPSGGGAGGDGGTLGGDGVAGTAPGGGGGGASTFGSPAAGAVGRVKWTYSSVSTPTVDMWYVQHPPQPPRRKVAVPY